MKRNNIPLDITEKHISRISLAVSIVTLLFLCVLIHSIDKNFSAAAGNGEEPLTQQEEEIRQAEEASVTTANLLFAGDNYYGEDLLNAGRSDEGNWNYEDVYSKVREKISSADLAVVQQPTVLTTEHEMVSGTDSYATPTEVGDALTAAGFDVVASAASHADDYGVNYLSQTLDFWGNNHPDITLLGLHRTQEEADTTQIREVNGIRIAFLDYAFGSHFEALPAENAYMIDYFEKEKVTADIQRAAAESDCVIVLAQWGDENNAVPGEFQKEWTQYLLSQGVTAVIGAHPHVLQPYEMLNDGLGHEMLVYYSLGDLVNDAQEAPKLLGGLGEFTLEKRIVDGQPRVRVVSATVTPTVMHYNRDENIYQTFLLSNYDDLLAAAHTIHETEGNLFSMNSLQLLFRHITGLRVSPSYDTDLLGMTCRADGSMTGADGSVLSADELAYRYPAATSGSLDALRAIMAGQAPVGENNNAGTNSPDSSSSSDSDSDSGYDSGYSSGGGYDSDSDSDSGYNSGSDSDSDSGYDSGSDSDSDSGYDSDSDSGYDSGGGSGYDSDSDSG